VGGAGAGAGAGGGDATAAANAACASANRRIAALTTPNGPAAVVKYLEATEAAIEQLQGEVAAVGGPAGVREFARALETSVGVLNKMSNAARSLNPDAVRELSKQLVDLHLGEVAEAAGLDTCAATPGVES
jgi:hypothetical protein